MSRIPATRETLFANPVAQLSVLGALHSEVAAVQYADANGVDEDQ